LALFLAEEFTKQMVRNVGEPSLTLVLGGLSLCG